MQKKICQISLESLVLIGVGWGITQKHGWAVAPLAQADYLPVLSSNSSCNNCVTDHNLSSVSECTMADPLSDLVIVHVDESFDLPFPPELLLKIKSELHSQ